MALALEGLFGSNWPTCAPANRFLRRYTRRYCFIINALMLVATWPLWLVQSIVRPLNFI
jgi:hypothetical protein